MPVETLRSNMSYLRFRKKLSRKAVGMLVEKTDRTVEAWEYGRATPQTPELEKLSHLFGVTIDDLVRVDLKTEILNEVVIFKK